MKKDIKDRNKRIIAKVLLYPVGNYDVKTEVVAGLANMIEGPDNLGRWPRNTLHLSPELCDEQFAKEMTAERLVDPDEDARSTITRRARRLIRPNAPREWKRVVGRQNDWFDATVYAVALGWHLEHKRRLNDARWADLLVAVHGRTPEPDLFETITSPFDRRPPPPTSASTRDRFAKMAARLNGKSD